MNPIETPKDAFREFGKCLLLILGCTATVLGLGFGAIWILEKMLHL